MSTTLRRGLAAAAVTMFGFAGSAIAGECPAGQIRQNATAPATHAAKGVTDNVLRTIELGSEAIRAQGHTMRLRRLVIQPGGIVPWHAHEQRPAIIYIVSGEIQEYSAHCAVAITHRAGDATAETASVSHWWKNNGKVPVVLISADIIKDPTDKNM